MQNMSRSAKQKKPKKPSNNLYVFGYDKNSLYGTAFDVNYCAPFSAYTEQELLLLKINREDIKAYKLVEVKNFFKRKPNDQTKL